MVRDRYGNLMSTLLGGGQVTTGQEWFQQPRAPSYSSTQLADQQAAQQAAGQFTNAAYYGPTSAQQRLSPTNPGPTLYGGPAPQQQMNITTGQEAFNRGGVLSSAQPTTLQSQIPQGAQQPAQQPYQQPAGQPPIQNAEYERIDPNLRTVQSNETVQGQLAGILASNSPLLQQARSRAQENMVRYGLSNSSMAQAAGEGAVIAQGLQIAQPDARTYAEAAKGNQDAINRVKEFNAAQFGETSRTNAGFVNRRGDINVQEAGQDRRLDVTERGQDRRQLVTEGGLNQRQQVTERGLGDRLLISEAGDTARQNSVNQTNITTTGMNNQTQRDVTKMNNDTQITTTGMNNATSLQTAQISADTARYGYELSSSTQRDIAEFNAESGAARDQTRMEWESRENVRNRVQQIVTNPDMTREYREQAIRDALAGGQSSAAMATAVAKLPLAVR